MHVAAASLPLTETIQPTEQAELVAAVRAAHAARTPLYPLGGGTALGFGMPAKVPGLGISLSGLTQVVDYPARDMTITVEAGITLAALAQTLTQERQRLPIDAPQADQATLGGLVATNFSGPRRYGCGTMRDYVIGISAVDGRGTPFKAGGRVVKNVAGYDLCKLLVGSVGTLGIITQVTLKLKPMPEASAVVCCDVASWDRAEDLLARLVQSQTTPSAIELVSGPDWHAEPWSSASAKSVARLLVGLEGTEPEVTWMVGQLLKEWQSAGVGATRTLTGDEATSTWDRLRDFAVEGSAALLLKFNVRPSAVTRIMEILSDAVPDCSLLAHAGNGIVLARLPQFSADTTRLLITRLRPAAVNAGGNVIVWSCESSGDLTRQAVWGPERDETRLMGSVKRQFDPLHLLNPGRFIFGVA